MDQDKEQVLIDAKKWRETEKQVIANKSDGEAQRQHFRAKMKLRTSTDVILSKETSS